MTGQGRGGRRKSSVNSYMGLEDYWKVEQMREERPNVEGQNMLIPGVQREERHEIIRRGHDEEPTTELLHNTGSCRSHCGTSGSARGSR